MPPAVRQQAFQTGFDPHKTGFLDAAQFINALSYVQRRVQCGVVFVV